MAEALITPDVLRWARKRAQFTPDGAAQKVQVRPERFIAWELSSEDNITLLSKNYRVSTLVIARRGYDLDLLGYDEFQEFYLNALQYDRRVKDRLSESDGGPGSYVMQKIRNGTLFSRAVTTAAFEGRLPLRDGAALLGIKPARLKNQSEKKRNSIRKVSVA